MVLACGVSQYSVALYHLLNHAYFKALLFLSAGCIIHGVRDEQWECSNITKFRATPKV